MGGTGRRYGGLDRFRPAAVALVVAIHTGPLLSVSPAANDLLTDILGRLAVPFFFMVTGFFLLPRLEDQGPVALLPLLKKTGLLYALSILLYLPLQIVNGFFSGLTFGELARTLLVTGFYYHLWYFPAVMLGACLVGLLTWSLPRLALPLCVLFYLLGLPGDSYYGLTAALPGVRACYDSLLACLGQTRNGLFFAPLFLLLGGRLSTQQRPRVPAWVLPAGLALLVAEGMAVHALGWPRNDSMYLSLPLCLWALTSLLLDRPSPPLPRLRRACTVIYIVHPLCVVGIRGVARLLGLRWLLVDCSPVYYLAVLSASACTALAVVRLLPARRRAGPCRAWTELDAAALGHNITALRALLPPACRLMAVVKADGYGHGMAPVARVCRREGVDAFAVATVEEGIRLRRAGTLSGEILVLGYTPPEQAGLLARHRLTQAVVSLEHALALARTGRRLRVHIKLDTGMHRLGIPWDDLPALERVCACPHLKITGIFTHLADAEALDPVDEARTQLQIRRFYTAVKAMQERGLPTGRQHIQSTYGLLNYGPLPCAYVRTGIALCGVLSRPEERTRTLPDLRPVLSLRAQVGQIHTLGPGERAGYDGSFVADGPCRVALVTIGYADGVPRSLSRGEGHVLIRGQRAPVAGLICMDQLLVDVTTIPDAAPGDVVTLIGRDGQGEISAGAFAQAAGTITNEIFSRLGPRLERIVVE